MCLIAVVLLGEVQRRKRTHIARGGDGLKRPRSDAGYPKGKVTQPGAGQQSRGFGRSQRLMQERKNSIHP